MTRSLRALLTLCLVAASAPALAQSDVFVVHGIPGADLSLPDALPVDISVDGECALPDFQFGDIAGPLAFAPGSYDIVIHAPNVDTPCSGDAIITAADVEIEDDRSYSIVAHLEEGTGAPTASVFANSVFSASRSPIINLFHAANAPAVDVNLTRRIPRRDVDVTVEGLAPGGSGAVQVRGGGYTADIFAAGTSDRVAPRLRLFPEPETTYLAFAVGSLENDTFTVLVTATPTADTASVIILHGINGADLSLPPNLPVDVSLNGTCVLPSFEFGQFAGPLNLAAGEYSLAVSVANPDSPCSLPPVASAGGVVLSAFQDLVVMAHVDDTGSPTLGVFPIDRRASDRVSRVNVIHAANAPDVDVYFGPGNGAGSLFFEKVANGESGDVRLRPGPAELLITAASDRDTRVLGPASLSLSPATAYVAIAVGTLGSTFDLFLLSLPGW